MSKNHCNKESSCCNNSYRNTYNTCTDGVSNYANSFPYILAILLLFGGGGSKPGSFWSNYNNMFLCSGFNNGWCSNTGSNTNFNSNNFSSSNVDGFINSSFNNN